MSGIAIAEHPGDLANRPFRLAQEPYRPSLQRIPQEIGVAQSEFAELALERSFRKTRPTHDAGKGRTTIEQLKFDQDGDIPR